MNHTGKQSWIYIDACKIFAMFFVVVMHVSAGAWGASELGTFDWQVLNVFNILSRFGIPLFLMLTGALFLSEKKEITLKSLYVKYLLPIVTAFFFWSVVNMLLYYWRDAPGGFADFTVGGFIDGVLKGDAYKHWFIFLIISLYLLIPILRAVARNLKACHYFLILWAVFSLVLPFLYQIPALFAPLPQIVQDVLAQAVNAAERVKPLMVLDYVGYFILGYCIHEHEFTRGQTIGCSLAGLAGLAASIGLTIVMSLREGASKEDYFRNVSWNIVVMSAGVMILLKAFFRDKWFKERTYKTLIFFAGGSFGIFLVHDFIRRALEWRGIYTLSFSPLFSVPLLSILVFVASAIIVYVIMKIPVIGKYIV